MTELRVGIAGLGAIGMTVARALDGGTFSRLSLNAVSARDVPRAQARVAEFKNPPPVVALTDLAKSADIVIECAPAAVFRELADAVIDAGRIFMPLSVGALLAHMDLVDRAKETGARIVVPSGAILGLDAVRAMAVGEIYEVRLETRKPPAGLEGAPFLLEHDISVADLSEAVRVFEGTAREAAVAFPANVNVAAALALAGIGPDKTTVEVWADPAIDRNQQSITIASDCGEAQMVIRNIPSEENPKTGKITANSVVAALRRFEDPLICGN